MGLGMKVDIHCLQGDPTNLAKAKSLAMISSIEVNSIDDITRQIATIYQDPCSPYPRIGTVRATQTGLIIPSIGECFFWITISDGGVMILEDFGSGRDRLDHFYAICNNHLKKCSSIWDFEQLWNGSHHKTSTEKLVSNYINHICCTTPNSSYSSWLGAKIVYEQTPLGKIFCGIDLRTLDTSSSLAGNLEESLYKSFIRGRLERFDEIFIKRLVKAYLLHKEISLSATITDHKNEISNKQFLIMCNDLNNVFKKFFKHKKDQEAFINNDISPTKIFKGC